MKLNESRPIRSVLILGSGLEAWLTAAVLAHRLDGRRIDLTVCPVSGSQAWDASYTALPSLPDDLFRELGYSDLKLARVADASFSLGTLFERPGFEGTDSERSAPEKHATETPEAQSIFKPHGPVGIDVGGVGFHQYWRRVSPRLDAEDYFRYSPGMEAFRRGVFAPPVPANAIGPLQHEMVRHVDPWALQKHLRQQAWAMGIQEARSPLSRVERAEDGMVMCLRTANGERHSADLYVDCSGPLRALFSDAEAAQMDAQSGWLAAPNADTAWMGAEHHHLDRAPDPYSTASGTESGWRFTLPRATERVELAIDDRSDRPGAHPFDRGHLQQPWQGRCVAIGTSSACILPLDSLPARLLMSGIERLVRLLPGRDCAPEETREFNQLMTQDAREALAFTSLLEAWRQGLNPIQAAKQGKLSDALAHQVRLFDRRGWVAPRDSRLIPDELWRSTLILLGVIPRQYDRLADRISRDQVEENLLGLKQRVRQTVRTFPPHEEYFAALRKAIADSSA